jgi:predicted dehydrogenase
MLRYGIIGCGMMGQEHLRNIALLEAASVAAIFEPDTAMRAAAAALVPEARMVGSVAELLAVVEVNCLMIASPNHLHLGQLEEIARIRPLPVLCEKPLFTDPLDAPRLAALRAAYPAPIWVAMEYRYMPPVAHLLREAQAATGGVKMLTIREHRFPFLSKVGDWNRFNRNSGGTLVEKCCHFFDLMRLVAGCDPVRVMASGGQAVNHLDEVYDGQRSDIWDHAYVIVDFASRACGRCWNCACSPKAAVIRKRSPPSERWARSSASCLAPAASGPPIWDQPRCRRSSSAPGRPPARSNWRFPSTRPSSPPGITTGRPSSSIRAFSGQPLARNRPRFR